MIFGRIINLDSRPDRWKLMEHYVHHSKYNLQRFSAIHFTKDDNVKDMLSYRAKADFQRERVQHEAIQGKGAIGCAVSHFLVWKEFLESQEEFCLVLEDDLNPKYAAGLDESIDAMLNINGSWDIALLGWCGKLPETRKDETIVPFPSSKGFVGAQAYLLNRYAAEVLVSKVFPLEMQIDFLMQSIADDSCLRIKASKKTKIRQQFTGYSNVFTFCLLCEPIYVYSLIVLLLVTNIYLLYKYKLH